ncbi:hypothetical protein Y032_0004g2158 [Ancylostoma ceylanicum]|uniref:Uncharacterized protein n=1 Tax=Ancylostoma ceylanicum TaxID=53326 RepID=A0A016VV20_9BILA|nr:hypothetical protein Y032_0004g2158 [Ancylostoma ceylanicum]
MSIKNFCGDLPIEKLEPSETVEPSSGSEQPPSLSPEQCDAAPGCIKEEAEWSTEYVIEQDYSCHESYVVIKTENPSVPPSPSYEMTAEDHDWDAIVKTEVDADYADSDEQFSYVSSLSTCRDNSAMDDVIIKSDPYLFDNSSVKSESAEHIEEQPSIGSNSIPEDCFHEDVTVGAEEVVTQVPASRGRRGKKRKSNARPKQAKSARVRTSRRSYLPTMFGVRIHFTVSHRGEHARACGLVGAGMEKVAARPSSCHELMCSSQQLSIPNLRRKARVAQW